MTQSILTVAAVVLAQLPPPSKPLTVDQANGSASPSLLEQRARLVVIDVSLPTALRELQRSSGVRLAWSSTTFPSDHAVSCQCDTLTVGSALTRLLAGLPLRFAEVGSHVLIEPESTASFQTRTLDRTSSFSSPFSVISIDRTPERIQRTGTVSGRVTNSSTGRPVSQAEILVVGLDLSTLSQTDGQFSIPDVPAGTHEVRIERLGFAVSSQEVTVTSGQTTMLNVALRPQPVALDEVVITGTPSGARRRTIGSSVAVIDAAAAMELSQAPDFSSLLNARAPGLRLNQRSGRLGSTPSIQIRGQSSIGLGNAPLVYIDGVRVNSETGLGAFGDGFGAQGGAVRGRLNDIHPDDIESIEVIKGPAAATIYGTAASNGVIQIITKRGAVGQDPELDLRMQYGSIHFRDAEDRMPTNYVRDDNGDVVSWNAVRQERERGTPLFRRGSTSEVHASLSAGMDRFRYYVSAAIRDESGVEPNNFGQQYSLHTNMDAEISPDITLQTSLNYTRIEDHLGADDGGSAMLGAMCGHALVFPESRGFCIGFVPELPWELYDNSDATSRFTASGTLDYRMTDWLRHRLVFGMDDVSSDARALERFAPEELAQYLPPAWAAGRIGQTLRDDRGFTVDYAGTATAAVTPEISSISSIGLQVDRTETRTSSLGGLGFPAPGVELISATATPLDASQSELINTTLGAYVEQKFGWQDRLFLTGALRVDNNSAFGEDLRWVVYPKVDASWTVSDEGFWPWGDVIGTLRVRTAYGESGRAPSAFEALRTFTPVQGPGNTNAVTAGSLGNPELKPERGKEWELGLETVVIDRLALDFTYFKKRVTDLIVNQSVAPSTGFSGSVPRNLGRVDVEGFEVSATFQALNSEKVSWQVEANIARNEDKIRDLGDVPDAVNSPGAANRVGYPIGGLWSRRVVSADFDAATQEAINVMCDGGPGMSPVPCSDAPFVFLGRSVPKTTGAIGNIVTVGSRVRLYALVDFASEYLAWNTDEEVRCTGVAGAPLCEINVYPERFSPVQVAQAVGDARGQGIVSQYYQDRSFWKLREVSATLTLPHTWIPRASRLSFTLSGRELATWTSFKGVDPENSAQAILPPLTRIIATLNIGF